MRAVFPALAVASVLSCAKPDDAAPAADSAVPAAIAAQAGPRAPALAETPARIEGIDWQWLRMVSPADSVWDSPGREKYTLRLEAGRATGAADCNRFTGSYTLDGRNLNLVAMATTRAYCGPDSLGDRYVRWLGQVTSHFTRVDTLFLELKFDSGTMVFVK